MIESSVKWSDCDSIKPRWTMLHQKFIIVQKILFVDNNSHPYLTDQKADTKKGYIMTNWYPEVEWRPSINVTNHENHKNYIICCFLNKKRYMVVSSDKDWYFCVAMGMQCFYNLRIVLYTVSKNEIKKY